MSWTDAIKDAVGNLVGEAEQAALPDLVKKVLGNEGLQSILAKLQDAGLQAQVSSWIDKNKTNLPITPEPEFVPHSATSMCNRWPSRLASRWTR